MEYGFNVEIAQKLGVNEAIIIRNFQHWLGKNKANNTNFYKGRFWTYNSIAAFCKIFPFWTERQIRNILKNLTDNGILIKGNFNKNPYDKTIWYSIDEENLNKLLSEHEDAEESQKYNEQIQNNPESTETVDLTNSSYRFDESGTSICQNGHIDLTNRAHRCDENVKPIPCVNTNSKPCVNTHTHERVCENFSQGQSANEPGGLNSCDERKGYTYTNNQILPNSREVDEFCIDYKTLKNSDFEPSQDDKIAIAKVLAKNGGYGAEKREYWCDVFKKASRGWKIIEHDITRIVPCSLDRVLNEHSRIKANELGLLPPKKDAPKTETQPEPEIIENETLTEEARQKARAMVNNLRRFNMPIG